MVVKKMANPLARVVMSSISQKSGVVETKSSNTNSTTNLGKRETQLLTSLLNNNKSTSGGGSYNKNTYGRSSNVSSTSPSMQSLNSLVSGKADTESKTAFQNTKADCPVNRSRQNLKSLCTLDNISVGKTNTSTNINASINPNRNKMQTLSLNELAKGDKSVKQEIKTSYEKQTGGMTTLGDLANVKSKHSDETKGEKMDNVTAKSGYVRSNVINNLEAYVPKVTLESIGKKGSLF